jgi:hypothetical protein
MLYSFSTSDLQTRRAIHVNPTLCTMNACLTEHSQSDGHPGCDPPEGVNMTALEKIQRGYVINVGGADAADVYRVSYQPRGVQQVKTAGRVKKAPEHRATVFVASEKVTWNNPPVDAEATREDFDADAIHRSKSIHGWLLMLKKLIADVEEWANDLGWSTKRIDKPMEDSEVGKYSAPALLLQVETTKLLMEPITRRAPGTEGVVDLYLMPGYDDIASLYFYNNRWNVHYASAEQRAVANIREVEAKPLTKAALKKVLEEMKANAQRGLCVGDADQGR